MSGSTAVGTERVRALRRAWLRTRLGYLAAGLALMLLGLAAAWAPMTDPDWTGQVGWKNPR